MAVSKIIQNLRKEMNMSQEEFADIFSVSKQAVQKWETGENKPDLEKLILISKRFNISLDYLILGNDKRIVEEMKVIKPQYGKIHDWEMYSSNLSTEYIQSIEEGLDIEQYKDLFSAVSKVPKGEIQKRLGDVLFDIVVNAKTRNGYKYLEPSDLDEIKKLRKPYTVAQHHFQDDIKSKISGAWMGRICGCLLGKTVEGVKTHELIPFLRESDNYPLHRYIYKSDIREDTRDKYNYPFSNGPYADEIKAMPVDDDTIYMVLAQIIIEKYGKDFTAYDISRAWLDYQKKSAYCTAERVAFCNFGELYYQVQHLQKNRQLI